MKLWHYELLVFVKRGTLKKAKLHKNVRQQQTKLGEQQWNSGENASPPAWV